MEINITKFFNTACPKDYSASAAEIGENAGRITWAAACDDTMDWNLLDDANKLDCMRGWLKASGGWDQEEINAFSDEELNAIFLQLISGDIRESGLADGGLWEEYQKDAEDGRVSGTLFQGADGQVYFSLEGY